MSPDFQTPEALGLRDLEALPDDALAVLSLERWRQQVFGSPGRSWYPTAEESDEFARLIGRALGLILEPAIHRGYFDVPARRQVLSAQRWIRDKLIGELS